MNQAAMNSSEPGLVPVRRHLAAVAQLRRRMFINSLRTKSGRLELASRVFITLTFAPPA